MSLTVQTSDYSVVSQNTDQPTQGKVDNSTKKKIIIYVSVIISIIGLTIFLYKWINLNTSTSNGALQNIIVYTTEILGSQKLDVLNLDKIARWQDPGSSYINFYLDSGNKTFVKYLPNNLTGRIEEIDVITKSEENKSLEEFKKEIEDGFYNNLGFVIQPNNWFTYNDENYPGNTISQVLWNSSSRVKESRGIYIDNSKGAKKVFLFACRLFEGSKAYEQNSCVVR